MKLIYTPYHPDNTRQTIIIENIEEFSIPQAIKLMITPPQKSSILQKAIRQEASEIIIRYPEETGAVLAISFYNKNITTPLKTFYVNCFQNLPINREQLIFLVNPPYPKLTLDLIKCSINNNVANTVLLSTLNLGLMYSFGLSKNILFCATGFMKNRLYQEMHEKIDDLPNPLKYCFKKWLVIHSTLLTIQIFNTFFSLFSRRRHDNYIIDSQASRTNISLKAAKHLLEEIISQANTRILSIKPGLVMITNSGFCHTVGSTDGANFCKLTLRQADYDTAPAGCLHDLVPYKSPEALPYLILDSRPETLLSWIGQSLNGLFNSAVSYMKEYFTDDNPTQTAVGFSLQDTVHSLGEILTHWIAQPEVNATLVQEINDCLMESFCPATSYDPQRPNNGTLFSGNPSFL